MLTDDERSQQAHLLGGSSMLSLCAVTKSCITSESPSVFDPFLSYTQALWLGILSTMSTLSPPLKHATKSENLTA